MTTINISLPDKLKEDAEALVKKGFFASFSELVRHSLRETIAERRYDRWYQEALEDERKGRGGVLRTDKDIDNFIKSL